MNREPIQDSAAGALLIFGRFPLKRCIYLGDRDGKFNQCWVSQGSAIIISDFDIAVTTSATSHYHTTMSMHMEAPRIYLDVLPAEIWLACWASCSLRQLRRISLVCRVFRSLVLPHLFRDQTFDVAALERGLKNRETWIDLVRHLHRTAVRLDRLVEAPFAPFVRSWKAAFSMRHPTVPLSRLYSEIQNIYLLDLMNDRVVKAFCATLGMYSNLSSLHLEEATIDASFRETLGSLSMLKDLHLGNCRIIAADRLLHLDNFKISGRSPKEPLRLASPECLRTLDVGHISPLIAGFGSDKLCNLVKLSIQVVRDVGELFRLFTRCPRLEELTIPKTLDSPLPALPARTIPLLHNITAPPAVVQLLTPTRPVRCARILDVGSSNLAPDGLMPLCMDISRSTTPLRSLVLPCRSPTLDFLAAISALFPDLDELCLKFPQRGFRCGTSSYLKNSQTFPIDQRTVDLNDDTAFDDLPVDDASDEEPEAPEPIIVTGGDWPVPRKNIYIPDIPKILGWIARGSLLLPPNIQIFRLEGRDSLIMSLAGQHRAIAALSQLYPHLYEVQFGLLPEKWKFNGESWCREVSGGGELLKVVPNNEARLN
ncbi:hypothetical protein K438DRAFT_1970203 [Mycena galopus ATCC 62051]|nr:hypothetical protein K438DRAFT_1970203 [Mycena galopus ATCC 62051]